MPYEPWTRTTDTGSMGSTSGETDTDPGTTGITIDERFAMAFQRINELTADVERRYQNIAYTIGVMQSELRLVSERTSALESVRVTPAEARESEPVLCNECGHPEWAHGWNNNWAYGHDCTVDNCSCNGSRPAAPPAPEPEPMCRCGKYPMPHRFDNGCSNYVPPPAPTVALDPVTRLIAAVSAIEQDWNSLDDGRYAISETQFTELLMAYNEVVPGSVFVVEQSA